MKTKHLFKVVFSLLSFGFFLFLAAGSSESSSSSSSSTQDSYVEPEETTEEEAAEEETDNVTTDQVDEFVPVNEGTEMPTESDEIQLQENGTEE